MAKQTLGEQVRTKQAAARKSAGQKVTLRDELLLQSQNVPPTQDMLHQDALKSGKTEVTPAMTKQSAVQNYTNPGPTQQMLKDSAAKAAPQPAAPIFENPLSIPKAEAASPKLTPEKLQQFRDNGISTSTIIKFYGDINPEFRQKYESGVGKFNLSTPDGQPLSWDDAALNMEAYGEPYPPAKAPAEQSNGHPVLGAIGNAAHSIWDYATAPMDAATGVLEKGLGKAMGRDVSQFPNVKNLDANLKQNASAAPALGGIIGEALGGPVGAGAGASIGKGFANTLEDISGAMDGKPNRPLAQNIDQVASTGLVNGITSGVAGAGFQTAKASLPAIKSAIIKSGGVLTNVADDVLERAFDKPQIIRTAINEIKDNVGEPFLNLSKQIGNTMKRKIDDAGEAIQKAKDFILKNNPGATFDVSSSADEIGRVLKEENLSLAINPNAKGKNSTALISGITQGKAKPFSEKELGLMNDYVQTINQADKYSLQDVLDLKKLYNRVYTELGTNDIGTTSNAQRVLRKIRTTVDDKISQAMPEDLANAYKDWSVAVGAYEDFPHFLEVNNQGKYVLSDKGEQYLNTMWGNTKGQRREDVNRLSEFLGIDINEKQRALKDAQALTDLFPKTGSRSLDVLRTFVSKWATTAGASVGGSIGGIEGAGIGTLVGAGTTAATSPLIVGKAIMKAGDFSKNRIVNSFVSHLSKLEPVAKDALLKWINDQNASQQQSQR